METATKTATTIDEHGGLVCLCIIPDMPIKIFEAEVSGTTEHEEKPCFYSEEHQVKMIES